MILLVILGLIVGYLFANYRFSVSNQEARVISSPFVKDSVNTGDVGKQNLNCRGLGSIIFETPPSPGVPGTSTTVTVAGTSYQREWGAIYQ